MTEQEWLTTEDPMAIYRLIEMHWNNKRIITYVGDQGKYSLEVSVRQILLWLAACIDLSKYDYPKTQRGETSLKLYRTGGDPSRSRADCINCLRLWCDSSQNKEGDPPIKLRAHLLRDVIGNPWQRVPPPEPQWLTPQVLSLAQAAWDDRPDDRPLLDPFRLLMLADALEEAGCNSVQGICQVCRGTGDETSDGQGWCRYCRRGKCLNPHPIIAHLRNPEPHIRGCWALDLILGKE